MARIKAFPRQLIVVQKPSLATQAKSWLFLLLLLLFLLFVCLFFFCGLAWFGFLLLERFCMTKQMVSVSIFYLFSQPMDSSFSHQRKP